MREAPQLHPQYVRTQLHRDPYSTSNPTYNPTPTISFTTTHASITLKSLAYNTQTIHTNTHTHCLLVPPMPNTHPGMSKHTHTFSQIPLPIPKDGTPGLSPTCSPGPHHTSSPKWVGAVPIGVGPGRYPSLHTSPMHGLALCGETQMVRELVVPLSLPSCPWPHSCLPRSLFFPCSLMIKILLSQITKIIVFIFLSFFLSFL